MLGDRKKIEYSFLKREHFHKLWIILWIHEHLWIPEPFLIQQKKIKLFIKLVNIFTDFY